MPLFFLHVQDDDEAIDPDIAARLKATNFDKLREEAQNPFRSSGCAAATHARDANSTSS